jgi:hypothetical protein
VISPAALALARRVALAALGAWIALYATAPLGPSTSPDSAIYLSVADNLAHGSHFTQFDDEPMTRWAPLYPALLAGVARATGGQDTAQAARAVNAIAWAVVLFLLAGWLDRRVKSWIVRAVAAFTLVVAPMLLQCVAFVWSETLYLALALSALRACEALIEGSAADARPGEPSRGTWLVVLGVATGAAALTRYAGVALVPVALGALVLAAPRGEAASARRAARLPRALETALVIAIALLPLAAWLLRNAVLTGHALGEGWGAHSGFSRNAAILVHIVSLWWFSPSIVLPLRLAFVAAVVSALVIALSRLARVGALSTRDARAATAPHLLFLASSVALLLAWASVSGIETISDRYAAPLFPSAVLLVAWTIDRLVRERAGAGLVTALALAGLLVAVHSAERTATLVRLYRGPGEWGYRTRNWESSGAMAAVLRVVPPGALVYSNAPDAIYARVRRPARLLPVGPEVDGAARSARELEAARRAIANADGGGYLVEFDTVQRSMLVSTETLASGGLVDTLTRASDGTILRIEVPVESR